jgi:hypothetical protein
MSLARRALLLLVLLVGVAGAAALPDPSAAEIEQNRRLLEKWRGDPEHYARLKKDLHDFKQLPPDRQAALRQLDHDLHDEDSLTLARLLRTADRYAAWLEHLPEARRARIQAETDPKKRLQVIRDIREEEWIDRLPRVKREQVLTTADPGKRASLIKTLHEEEQQRQQDWQRVLQGNEPPARRPSVRVADLPPEARNYVEGTLLPQLNTEEKKRLKDAEGKWPLFPRTLLELADSHAGGLPGPASGPKHQDELPMEVRRRLMMTTMRLNKADRERLKQHAGKWPDYAIAVTEIIRGKGLSLPEELGPARLRDMPEPVREFVDKKLQPVLTRQEKDHLKAAEGRWPDYPRALLELARAHGLAVPAPAHLPESLERLRQAVTELPEHTLRDFALNELSPEERANLHLDANDQASKERLKQKYFERHPAELFRIHQSDVQKFLHKFRPHRD